MAPAKVVPVGWEYEVPAAEVEAARTERADELAAYYHTPVPLLTEADVARFLIRMAEPHRYLRADVWRRGA